MPVAEGGFEASGRPAPAMLTGRLSLLMFMQFFVWGAWNVTLGLVMQTVGIGSLIGNAFSVGPIASIVGSFLLGMAAARYLSPKMLMVILHLVGGAILFVLPSFVTPERALSIRAALPGTLATDMESVAIAQTSYVHGREFVSVRAVSDLCGPVAHSDFLTHVDDAAQRSADAVVALLREV